MVTLYNKETGKRCFCNSAQLQEMLATGVYVKEFTAPPVAAAETEPPASPAAPVAAAETEPPASPAAPVAAAETEPPMKDFDPNAPGGETAPPASPAAPGVPTVDGPLAPVKDFDPNASPPAAGTPE